MNISEILDMLEQEDDRQRSEGFDPSKRNNSIPRDVGEFTSVLIRLVKPKTILEIGTSVGYSTIWLGVSAASYGGRVISYEKDAERAQIAKENIAKAGLDGVVEIRNEDALEAELPSCDFVFLDAERDDYVDHFDHFFPKLNQGGGILANNTLGYFEQLRKYIEKVRDHPECNSVLVAIGHGLELTYKFSNSENEAFRRFTMVR
ncbi:MAG: hypothetical protein D6732_25595 [Methanobacteriota archaeon]|nr:MAG: hypothetical protein D6732_25595 [Euryarchaeota archaeon]